MVCTEVSLKAGNLAIRDHDKNVKPLLLFESLGKSKPEFFTDDLACLPSHTVAHSTTLSSPLLGIRDAINAQLILPVHPIA